MAPSPNLDGTDRVILDALRTDARLPNNRLAERAGVAPSTALARARSLVDRGVVRGFHAEVDLAKVGRGVQALVAVRLRAHDRGQIEAFRRRVPTLPEVVVSYHVAGIDDYVLHVAVASAEQLRDFVLEHLTTDPVVGHTETSLVFEVTQGHDGPL